MVLYLLHANEERQPRDDDKQPQGDEVAPPVLVRLPLQPEPEPGVGEAAAGKVERLGAQGRDGLDERQVGALDAVHGVGHRGPVHQGRRSERDGRFLVV